MRADNKDTMGIIDNDKEMAQINMTAGPAVWGYGMYMADKFQDGIDAVNRQSLFSNCGLGRPLHNDEFVKIKGSKEWENVLPKPTSFAEKLSQVGKVSKPLLATAVGFSLFWHGNDSLNGDSKEGLKNKVITGLFVEMPIFLGTFAWFFDDISHNLSALGQLHPLSPLCAAAQALAGRKVEGPPPSLRDAPETTAAEAVVAGGAIALTAKVVAEIAIEYLLPLLFTL